MSIQTLVAVLFTLIACSAHAQSTPDQQALMTGHWFSREAVVTNAPATEAPSNFSNCGLQLGLTLRIPNGVIKSFFIEELKLNCQGFQQAFVPTELNIESNGTLTSANGQILGSYAEDRLMLLYVNSQKSVVVLNLVFDRGVLNLNWNQTAEDSSSFESSAVCSRRISSF